MSSTVERSTPVAVPAFARGPVFMVAGVVAVLLTAVSGRYGYFGDELYFLAAGHHLAWGYADQPPLVPLIALAMDTIAPGSVVVLRIPATLAMVVGIVLVALLAREFGGARRAQLIAAAAFAVSPQFLGGGHLLATSTFDPVGWTALCWLVVRWVRTRADRLLLAAGVLTAVMLEVKFLVAVFWMVALGAVLMCGPRELVRRPALWAGGAIAVLATVPTLVWQAADGWPQLGLTVEIAAEGRHTGGVIGFLPEAFVAVGLLIGSVLAVHGTVVLLRDPGYRFLGVTALGVALVFLLIGGRPYYVAGMFPLLWAASAARIETHKPALWWRWVPTWPLYGLTALVIVLVVLPVAPIASHAGQPANAGNYLLDEIGWPAMVGDIAAAYRALPPPTTQNAVVITDTYWTMSAVAHYAPGLPVYSYDRGAAWFGTPPDSTQTVLFVGDTDPAALATEFGRVTRVGTLDDGVNVNNATQATPIYLLEDPREPVPWLWASARHL